MEAETKSYISKRKKVMDIIQNIPVNCQAKMDDELVDYKVNVDLWSAKIMAEKILSKFGFNIPNELEKEESEGYMISDYSIH